MAKINAHQNPSTSNPGIISSAKRIIKAFMTNRNNPKVRIVKGKVKIIMRGLIVKLIKIKTAASKIPVIQPSI